jgi:hypothetical protein
MTQMVRYGEGGQPAAPEAFGKSEVETKALTIFADSAKEHAVATANAHRAIDRDPGSFLRFPYAAVHELTGPIVPGDFVTIAGFSGHGKTTLLTRCFNRWTSDGVKMLYVGLESPTWVIKVHWACARLADQGIFIHPGDAIKGKLNPRSPEAVENAEHKGLILKRAIDALDQEDANGFRPKDYGRIVPVSWLTASGVTRLSEWAYANGFVGMIIDHGDHVKPDAPTGGNGYGEREQVLQAMHDATRQTEVIILNASQMNTDAIKGDALRVHLFPTTDMVMYGAMKRQMSDLMLAVYKPAMPFPTDPTIENLAAAQEEHAKRLRAARKSPEAIHTMLLPGMMAVGQMKDRAYGNEGPQAVAYLNVRAGALTDADPLAIRAAQRGLVMRTDGGPPRRVGQPDPGGRGMPDDSDAVDDLFGA